MPKNFKEKENYKEPDDEEEQTYNNLESILKDVKKEDNVEREESVASQEEQLEEENLPESDKEINKRGKKLRKKNFDEDEEDYEDIAEDEDEQISDDDEDEFSEEVPEKFTKRKRGRDTKTKNRKKTKSRKKTKKGISDLLEIEASESDEAEESESGGEISAREQKLLYQQQINQREKNQISKSRKHLDILDQNEEQLIERYENIDNDEYLSGDEVGQQARQPSISDPKLWYIKCRVGKERECVETLFHKYFSDNKEDSRIKILSASAFDGLKGSIYIEAFKEANVIEAIQGISALRENSIKLVPMSEMVQVFNYDLFQKVDLQPKQWVRIKSGVYENDLAQVIKVEDPINRIWIRLVPRLTENDTFAKNQDKNRKIRPKQKLFNPEKFENVEKKNHPSLSEMVYHYNKFTFQDGFLIKNVKAKSLITEDVLPRIEELQIFDLIKMKNDQEVDNLLEAIQETRITRKKKFSKGDKVKVIKGEVKGLTGKVDSHQDKIVKLYADIEGYNQLLEFPEDFLVKEFLPGDRVKVVVGPHAGKYGLIVKIEDESASIFSDATNSEFKVSCNDIVFSNYVMNEVQHNMYYSFGDIVKINGTSAICYVLDVNKFSLKLIDLRGAVSKVSVSEVVKITQSKPNGIDSRKNPITKDDHVKIINGIYKGKKGVIKNIFKNYAFLYNQDFVSTNGIFVDKTENLEILGSELLNDYYTSGGKVNYRKAPESLTRNLGNLVRVIAGNWKGYIGILKKANDKMVSVELTSKNKIITLDLNSIQLIDNEGQKREDIYNNSFSTPRSNFANKTPAYYPQSPNAHSLMSPGWNPSTPNYQSNSPNPYRYSSSPGRNYSK